MSVYRFATAAQGVFVRLRASRTLPQVEKPRRAAELRARKPSDRIRAPGVFWAWTMR